MKSTDLVAIPKELLFIIFSHLAPHNLSMLCYFKSLSAISQKLLYRRYSGNSSNIFKFLRTILGNSTLASEVQHVYLDRLHTFKDLNIPVECMSRFKAAILKLPVSYPVKRHWIQRMIQGHREALAALLLFHLPNLTTLEIWTQDQYARKEYGATQFLLQGKPFWTMLMPEPASPTLQMPFLNNVRTLNLLSLPCSVYDLARAFTLPVLESLHAWDVVDTRQHRELPLWAFKPRSNKILALALTNATLSMGTLGRMLLSCSELKSFAYNCPIPPPNQDFGSLIGVISTLKTTLKSLTLMDQNAWSHEMVQTHSLKGFSSLENFSGDAAVLVGESNSSRIFDVLPQSLRQLHLENLPSSVIDDLGGAAGILERFLECSFLLPQLSKVSLVRSACLLSKEDFISESYLHYGLELCIHGKLAHDFDPYE